MPFRRLFAFSAVAVAFAQYSGGVDPRPSVADYPGRAGNDAVSIGAQFLGGPDQRKILGKDWSGSWLILEVALYPEPGKRVKFAPPDFMLRTGTGSLAPVDAEVLVPYPRTHGGPIGPDSKVHVQTVETVGVAAGSNGRKTVYAGSEVAVAVGDYPGGGPPPPADPHLDLRRALQERELPDAETSQPVAGYIYFPKPRSSAKNAAYELDYYGESGQLKLALAKPR
jgi:hypothetical protein